MIFDLRSKLAKQVHEVLLDHTNDVEAIRYDLGVGEVSAHQSAIRTAQVHTDDPDVFFAFERSEVSLKVFRGAAFDDIEDPMGSEITERGCEAGSPSMPSSLAMDRVLIDAENWRADAIKAFSCPAPGVFVVEALDGRWADCFAFGQNATGDPGKVHLVDGSPVWLGRVPIAFNAR